MVVGTKAIEDWSWFQSLARDDANFAHKLVLALDAKDGIVATRGWTEAEGPTATELAKALAAQGVRWLIVTAVARDGTLEGFDLGLLREVTSAVPEARLIASGGAGELSHLRALASAGLPALAGAIAGTALYEHRFTVREGQAALGTSC